MRKWWVAVLVLGVAALAGVVAIFLLLPRLPSALPRPAPGKPMTVWGRLVSYAGGELTVTLAPAPTTYPSLENPEDEPSDAAGQRMTVTVPAGIPLQSEYYVGDVTAGSRVHAEALELSRLQPGMLLMLETRPVGFRRWEATAITRKQSLPPQPPLPPPDIPIPPPIRPP